jgi:hypothetical protein
MAFDRSVVVATALSLRPQDPGRIVGQPQRLDKGSVAVLRRSSAPTTNIDCG